LFVRASCFALSVSVCLFFEASFGFTLFYPQISTSASARSASRRFHRALPLRIVALAPPIHRIAPVAVGLAAFRTPALVVVAAVASLGPRGVRQACRHAQDLPPLLRAAGGFVRLRCLVRMRSAAISLLVFSSALTIALLAFSSPLMSSFPSSQLLLQGIAPRLVFFPYSSQLLLQGIAPPLDLDRGAFGSVAAFAWTGGFS
jgi:hypothetical protein